LYTDVLNGNAESNESVLHKLEAIDQIKLGLQVNPAVSEALIGAVASLAKVEVSLTPHIRPGSKMKLAYNFRTSLF
jgi:hypothetical protein